MVQYFSMVLLFLLLVTSMDLMNDVITAQHSEFPMGEMNGFFQSSVTDGDESVFMACFPKATCFCLLSGCLSDVAVLL